MLRIETKSRARALQLLYAWELQGAPPMVGVAAGLSRLTGPEPTVLDRAEALAAERGIARLESLDAEAGARGRELAHRAASPWSSGTSCGSAILELRRGEVPPKVVIDEAVRLAHWFGGARAPGFVNGVLDGIARAARAALIR